MSKPLVVIAGWLGAQPRQLLRYEEIYRRAGFQALSWAPTPRMTFNSIVQPPIHGFQRVPENWPSIDASMKSHCLQDLAWNVLAEVHKFQPSFIMFHVLSTGGCTFWEHVRKILDEAHERRRTPQLNAMSGILKLQHIDHDVRSLRNRVAGVVFDSGPAEGIEKGPHLALSQCTPEEQLEVLQGFGASDISLFEKPEVFRQLRDRGVKLLLEWINDEWALPQLYLYSKADPLAKWESLDEIATIRQSRVGGELIRHRRFEDAPHVALLKMYPDEYEEEITSFVSVCKRNLDNSRL